MLTNPRDFNVEIESQSENSISVAVSVYTSNNLLIIDRGYEYLTKCQYRRSFTPFQLQYKTKSETLEIACNGWTKEIVSLCVFLIKQ